MKTRDQLRAERANALVTALKPETLDEYVGELRELPAMVVQSGIGPALAFIKARSGPVRSTIYDHLSSWVCEIVFAEPKGDLLTLIMANPASKLMRAQEETLSLAAWLRRFAEARDPKARKS
jgi:CRISPR type III-B/RAMP module-associated protein Cmr5